MMPIILRSIICLLFGHKWEKVPDLQSWDPYRWAFRPSCHCSRCHKTK